MMETNSNTKQKTAQELAKNQREISISEFFIKNRHLLGFDNPLRALLMTVKEAVDNSLDATGEIGVLPEIKVMIKEINENRFTVIVEDNGPGIIKSQIPNVFGKLLYGSKFHTLKQNRGQQGIGISASVLYSQLTTGKPTKIFSKINKEKMAHYYELQIDTQKNIPNVLKEDLIDWLGKEQGIKLEIELEAKYQKGKQSVDEYLKQTAIVNPHLHLIYDAPDNTHYEYPRVTNELPIEAKEIKPHPYGIELGTLIKMLHDTKANTITGFLQTDFCRVGAKTAQEICAVASMKEPNPRKVQHHDAEKLFKAMQEAKIMTPPTDCISPITAEILEKGLRKEVTADFFVSTTRPPSVYRGHPFQIESAIAYGGDIPQDSQVRLLRFANRVPLLYQQGACAITESISETNWRPYGLQQSGNTLPAGPVILVVHIASVWVPFTSEAKDAVAHYPEIMKEIRLAVQECGRKLSVYIHKHIRAAEQRQKIDLFQRYIPELSQALSLLTNSKKDIIEEKLQKLLKRELPTLEAENGAEKR